MVKLIGLHGAFSSPNSLNFIKNTIKADWTLVNYSNKINGVQEIIDQLNNHISEPSIIIGHSLGGIIGINLLKNKNIKKVITISSPVNGLKIGYFAHLFLINPTFINELYPTSKIIKQTKTLISKYENKITSVISTKGFSPYFIEQNDGVVTVQSQIYGGNKKVEVMANHHEVLQMPETLNVINSEISS